MKISPHAPDSTEGDAVTLSFRKPEQPASADIPVSGTYS